MAPRFFLNDSSRVVLALLGNDRDSGRVRGRIGGREPYPPSTFDEPRFTNTISHTSRSKSGERSTLAVLTPWPYRWPYRTVAVSVAVSVAETVARTVARIETVAESVTETTTEIVTALRSLARFAR